MPFVAMVALRFLIPIKEVNSQAKTLPVELEAHGIRISMDGRGRFQDNIFIERLWWTVKHHYVYLRAFDNGADLRKGLKHWFEYYNQERFHQSLGDLTPDEVYFKEHKWPKAA